MKITKTEKRWLFFVVLFYVLYNLPFVPAYNDPKGLVIHAALVLIPLWISVYAGLIRVFQIYKVKDKK